MKSTIDLSRSEKILFTLYELSEKSRKSIRYEDIVVALFKKYSKDFHLKGYPEYPDSGDHIHKPLYDFRKRGLVEAGSKMFALTIRGLEAAGQIEKAIKGTKINEGEGRLPHFVEKEISRIGKLESLNMFVRDEKDKLLDTDFYDYLDVTVRTPKNDFLGRIETMNAVMDELRKTKNGRYKILIEFHKYLIQHFTDIVSYMTKAR